MDRLDRVADELEAQRLRMRRREDVEDAAAHAEVAAVLDQRHAPVAPVDELLGERVAVDLVAFDEVAQRAGEDARAAARAAGAPRRW